MKLPAPERTLSVARAFDQQGRPWRILRTNDAKEPFMVLCVERDCSRISRSSAVSIEEVREVLRQRLAGDPAAGRLLAQLAAAEPGSGSRPA